MKKKYLVSVIVPVYNSEKYLNKCITSILNQVDVSIEIILVDDGSTDRSLDICKSYESKYSNIRVIQNQHRGTIVSRKTGIEEANCDWIGFVDSDDYIDEVMYKKLTKLALSESDVDFVSSGIIQNSGGTSHIIVDGSDEGVYVKEEIESDIIPSVIFAESDAIKSLNSSLCSKLFNKEFIKRIINEIDEHITFGEDHVSVILATMRAKKIVVTHDCFYHYIRRMKSQDTYYSIDSYERIAALNRFLKKITQNDLLLQEMGKKLVKHRLLECIKMTMGIDMVPIVYQLPFYDIPKGCKIVLYGAGQVGTSFYKQIVNIGLWELVLWVDKNYDLLNKKVSSPSNISNYLFDYVIIGVNNKDVSEEIKISLKDYNVNEDKILWKKASLLL